MNKLKFRAWNGDYFEYTEFNFKTGCLGCNFSHYVEIDTPQQCTGLKDINDIDIYEGDIVSGVTYSDYSTHNGFILFDYNGYRINTKTKSLPLDLTEKLKVIGNIYENPELLELSK